MSDTDPFPRERVAATLRRMPRYGKLAWRLGRDPPGREADEFVGVVASKGA